MPRGAAALALAAMLALSGCASLSEFAVSLTDPIAAAEHAYARGDLMKARRILLEVPKDDPRYEEARRLLHRKVDPARRKLIRRYRLAAERAEREGRWWRAAELYEQAASFSIAPQELLARKKKAEMRVRKARFLQLLEARRAEDEPFVRWREHYAPGKALDPEDWVLGRKRREVERLVEQRADRALEEARFFLGKGLPEIAFVEIESHLRLAPDSEEGRRLYGDVLHAMPKELRRLALAPHRPARARHARNHRRVHVPKPSATPVRVPSLAELKKAVEARDWQRARRMALAIRRGGKPGQAKEAARMLVEIDKAMAEDARKHYARGRVFFRKEQLDAAIAEWEKAVRLDPDSLEYEEALRRARLLKERLELLRATEQEPAPEGESGENGKGKGR